VFSTNPIYRESKQLPIHLTIHPSFFANTKEKPPFEKPVVASQFSTRTLQNVKCHGCVYTIPPLIPVLSPVKPVDTFLPHFSEIHFILITIYASTTQVVSFPQVSLPKFPMDIARVPHASHSLPFRCHLASNAVTELLGMQYATVPSYLPYQVRIFTSTSGKSPTYVPPSVDETIFTSLQTRE
jgi:hypothetical protein